MTTPSRPGRYEFGPFRLDPVQRVLWRDEEMVSLAPKAVDVLLALVQKPGQIVGKEALLQQVWPDTFVEEANLSVHVSALRKVLGDKPDGRPLIETIPRRGYRFAGEVASRPVAAPRSIAVLPLRRLGGDEEYLGVGMADAVITRLAQLGGVLVRPTAAVLRYATPQRDVVAAGRALDVEAVLDGFLQREGDRVRVTAQLVGVTDGATLWAGTFEETATRLFAIQDALSQQLARALMLELGAAEEALLKKPPTESPEAYQAYLKGRYFWNKLTAPWLRKARDAFQQAIDKDPAYARAHSGLADTYTLLGLYGVLPPKDAWAQARSAAMRAIELDESVAEAHVSLGYARLFQDWAWSEAEKELRRAIELSPRSAGALQWYALFLGVTGRFADALEQLARAQQVDPLSLTVHTNVGLQLYLMQRSEEEIQQYRQTLEMEPEYALGHWALGLAFEQMKKYDDALAEYGNALELSGGSVHMKIGVARVLAKAGRTIEALAVLRELDSAPEAYVSPYGVATVYVALGERSRAFECLDNAFEERDYLILWLQVDPALADLQSDPRFKDLVKKVGFPAYASRTL